MYCAELMKDLGLQLRLGSVNVLNGFAGCGKTEFLLKYLIEQPELYIENIPERFKYLTLRKNRILYVTDTKNLKRQMINKHNCKELKRGVLKEYIKNDIKLLKSRGRLLRVKKFRLLKNTVYSLTLCRLVLSLI